MDFYNYNELDPMFILSYVKGKIASYPGLLPKLDKEVEIHLSKEELLYLKFLSVKLANGKRAEELKILKELIHEGKYSLNDEIAEKHALMVLDRTFYKTKDQEEYEKLKFFEEKDGTLYINKKFKKLLEHEEFKENICDIITLGLTQFKDKYHEDILRSPFKYYEKYSREDVVRLLNFTSNDYATIYGYRTKKDIAGNLHCPIFVTYHKKDTISKTTQYEDKFINRKQFSWMTRSNLKIESKEVQQIIQHKENGNKLYLFINKSDDEGNEFYFIGEVEPEKYEQTTIMNDKEQEKPIVNFKFKIDKEVRKDIYEYIIN